MTPDWYVFVLLALAAFRVWKLLGDDVILDRPREWVLHRLERNGRLARGVKWSTFLVCPWCAGFWVSLLVYLGWVALGPGQWESDGLFMAGVTVFGLSAVVGLLATAHDAATGE